MHVSDTIVAISSAVGPAARMIVRVSGSLASRFATELSKYDDLRPGASRARLHFAHLSVPAWLYVFRAPRSYTGDDLIEFHIPGNPVLARLLLDHLRAAGARAADPGEFTARAFFNARIGLTEAEGVAATIAAHSETELAAARQLMAGELARRLRPVIDAVAETLALVEVGIDFADEDVTFLSPDQVQRRATDCDAALRQLLDDSTRFERIAHEPTAVLVGRPNAGKSTLLNALAGQERAVTSSLAGTTRDALSAEVALVHGIIRVIDVAGLDDSPDATGEIEQQMRDHTLRTVNAADFVLLVHDVTSNATPLRVSRPPDMVIRTKCDLLPSPLGTTDTLRFTPSSGTAGGDTGEVSASKRIAVSARTGANLQSLREALDRLVFGTTVSSPRLALNARHVTCIEDARAALSRAASIAPNAPPEVIALELRESLHALGRVAGAVTPDDLLSRIFSSFCIGK